MAPSRRRLDAELVRRKLARSRQHAADMIKNGHVIVGGFKALKPASVVEPDASIKITEVEDQWASRGAHKLLGALAAFEPQGLTLQDRTVLDAGASTGGFTDVSLQRGAQRVYAVDVGYGQLIWRLQNDDRIVIMDRTNVRHLTPQLLAAADTGVEPTPNGPSAYADVMVGDLSFISLKLVLSALAGCIAPGGDLLPMVKPQFEVGKERLGHGGVVRSSQLREETVLSVAEYATELGLSVIDVVASPLPGPSGNVEYFLWLRKDNLAAAPTQARLEIMVNKAVEEGPA